MNNFRIEDIYVNSYIYISIYIYIYIKAPKPPMEGPVSRALAVIWPGGLGKPLVQYINKYIYSFWDYITIYSLTKRSLKGFLLNVLMAGRCEPPRLVPPGASPLVPPSKYPKSKVPPKFPNLPKFPPTSFKYQILNFLFKFRF